MKGLEGDKGSGETGTRRILGSGASEKWEENKSPNFFKCDLQEFSIRWIQRKKTFSRCLRRQSKTRSNRSE